jgi:hypothetical protein
LSGAFVRSFRTLEVGGGFLGDERILEELKRIPKKMKRILKETTKFWRRQQDWGGAKSCQ